MLSACGGGTSGTGIDETTFEGNIRTADGSPVAGVDVTALESQDIATTDDDGHFSLVIPQTLQTLHLQFRLPEKPDTQELEVPLQGSSSASDLNTESSVQRQFILSPDNVVSIFEENSHE